MATISLCMIVRNEENVLARCLESVKGIADEIIIADTGSEDSTKEIAASFGARMYDFPWNDDFSAARNFTFSKAECDYQLWLDADDVIEGKNRERFLSLKNDLTADVVMLPYEAGFDTEGRPSLVFYRERLLRRDKGFRWQGAVHECIVPTGNIIYGDAAVSHRKTGHGSGCRNLRIYQRLRAEGHEFSARELYYYGRELADNRAYKAAIGVFREFLIRNDSWYPDCQQACLRMADCYMAIGEIPKADEAIAGSLVYGSPSAEICCRMGDMRLRQQNYHGAVFWYKAALLSGDTDSLQVFTRPEYRSFIPSVQLCLCYDRMGETDEAYRWHKNAMKERPEHSACRYNEEYFKGKGCKDKS